MRKTSEAGTGFTHGPHGPANVCRRLKEIIRPIIGSLGGFCGEKLQETTFISSFCTSGWCFVILFRESMRYTCCVWSDNRQSRSGNEAFQKPWNAHKHCAKSWTALLRSWRLMANFVEKNWWERKHIDLSGFPLSKLRWFFAMTNHCSSHQPLLPSHWGARRTFRMSILSASDVAGAAFV